MQMAASSNLPPKKHRQYTRKTPPKTSTVTRAIDDKKWEEMEHLKDEILDSAVQQLKTQGKYIFCALQELIERCQSRRFSVQ